MNQEKEKLIFKHIIKIEGIKANMNALFDALYFSQIVSFLWFYLVKAWFKRNDLPQFWKCSQLQVCFPSPFTKNALLFYEGFFWTYLKSPQYICVYLRAQIALILFWMLY